MDKFESKIVINLQRKLWDADQKLKRIEMLTRKHAGKITKKKVVDVLNDDQEPHIEAPSCSKKT